MAKIQISMTFTDPAALAKLDRLTAEFRDQFPDLSVTQYEPGKAPPRVGVPYEEAAQTTQKVAEALAHVPEIEQVSVIEEDVDYAVQVRYRGQLTADALMTIFDASKGAPLVVRRID